MKQEIERKFLVTGERWRAEAGAGLLCCQGYITSGPVGATVRVRIMGEQGFLTIKGPTRGIARAEYEYEIPAADAEYMLENLCDGQLVSKKRHTINVHGQGWEVDEFLGLNSGLIVAEIELTSADQSFDRPEWLGGEVSFDPRYTNAMLARHPFTRW